MLFIVRIAKSEKIKKIFAFNVDIFKSSGKFKNWLTFFRSSVRLLHKQYYFGGLTQRIVEVPRLTGDDKEE